MAKDNINYEKLSKAIKAAIGAADITSKAVSAEELSAAIVAAYETIKASEATQIREQHEGWLKALKVKADSTHKNWFVRKVYNAKNNICFFFRVLFIKRENIYDGLTTGILFQQLIALLIGTFEFALYLINCALLISLFYHPSISNYSYPFYLLMLFATFVFARILRMAGIEVAQMKNKNYLFVWSSAIISLVALIISMVALFIR